MGASVVALVAVVCPDCGALTTQVHSLHERTLGDVPVNGQITYRRTLIMPLSACELEDAHKPTF